VKIRDWVPSVILLLIAVFFIVSSGHCSTKSKKDNSTCWFPEGCVAQYTTNPYTYKVGALIGGEIIGSNEGAVVRIQPLATYGLFTEDILLCGVPADKFAGKSNPLVLTYKTKASRLVQGIGCHELVRVDQLQEEKPQR
jgi:hypothetical protein